MIIPKLIKNGLVILAISFLLFFIPVVDLANAQTKDTCIVSIDKDLDQIPGEHYHPGIRRQQVFIREPKFYTITPEQGLYFFYYQLLIGDGSDNIKGAPGIGPKKADKILFDCKTK
jgi:5'-3' exonuclease